MREALFAALDDPSLAETRDTLGLAGARVLMQPDYERVLALERTALTAGYPKLS